MNFSSTNCYEVRHFDGQGNGLFATRDIEKGELIFKEFPFVWNGFKIAGRAQSSFCYTCGECVAFVDTPVQCNGECQVQFCSRKCRSITNASGHSFICSCYKRGGLVDKFSQTNKSGHLALALQCYMHIAQTCVNVHSENHEPAISRVKRCANIVLGGYHKVDYCHTNHAVRTGRTSLPDEDLFESMIAPAYFATHLADGLKSIHEVFAALPLSMWSHQCHTLDVGTAGTDDDGSDNQTRMSSEKEAAQLREAFLSAEKGGLFHPVYFRHLMGMFVVNSYHAHLQSKTDPSVQLVGTALYPTVSKMNHSCESNIVNSHSETDVQLSVYATSPILKGQELTTSYLHRRPVHAKPQSRCSRHKCMLQYLFTCTCPKCEKERLVAQRIRRAKRGDPNTDDADSEYSDDDDDEEESSSSEEDEWNHHGANQCY